MICPICGLLMDNNVVWNLFECPKGHYKIRVSWGLTTFTSPLILSATLPRNWEDEPIKTPVPQEFHQAFADVEVLEP